MSKTATHASDSAIPAATADAAQIPPPRRPLALLIGTGLIISSYVLWGLAVLCGALALRGTRFPWGCMAGVSLVLNWIVFAIGVALAGPTAARMIHRKLCAWITGRRRRKGDAG